MWHFLNQRPLFFTPTFTPLNTSPSTLFLLMVHIKTAKCSSVNLHHLSCIFLRLCFFMISVSFVVVLVYIAFYVLYTVFVFMFGCFMCILYVLPWGVINDNNNSNTIVAVQDVVMDRNNVLLAMMIVVCFRASYWHSATIWQTTRVYWAAVDCFSSTNWR